MKNSPTPARKAGLDSVAVVSPGLLPIPPVIGGSVETVIQKMVEEIKSKFTVSIYGPTHPILPTREQIGNLSYYRFPTTDYSGYFKMVRAHINNRNYGVIQVENRPLFIPKTKAANPGSKFICSLHSLIHIDPKLIGPSLTLTIFRQCDRVLVYSKFMRDRLIKQFPSAADRFHFIHLATEPGRFKPRWEVSVKKKTDLFKKRLGIPENDKVILFAGRVIPKKGVHILLEAMEHLLMEYPQCCLVIVGSGWFGSTRPSPYIRELHQRAVKIAKNIRFTNYVRSADLPIYFAMADAFVCPSQWDEPFGLVNVEAMASGVPVVASARGGIPEIVTDGVNGFLVQDEGSPEAFVRALLKLLKNPGLAKSFGISGRKTVEEYFNWQRAGQELSNMYETLLGT
ncbi:MAG: glycosyltransferase family 4 protein [Eubacteriales bacterium]